MPRITTPTASAAGVLQRAEEFSKREPAKAVLSGFGLGLVLNALPFAAIASVVAGIAFTLLRPALLFLGLVKAFELYQKSTQNPPSHD